jgi:HK97 gp10 family phage protein
MMLRSRIPQITREMEPAVAAALRLGAQVIADDAASRIHPGADPHHIAEDIHVVPLGGKDIRGPLQASQGELGGLGFLVQAGRDDTYYGHILEHGSATATPRPFLIPALEAKANEVVKDVKRAIRKAAK